MLVSDAVSAGDQGPSFAHLTITGLPMRTKCSAISVIILMTVFFISGCASQKTIKVPSLTPVPSGEQLTGKFVWYDLFTDDLEATVTFYNRVFGWLFIDTATNGIPVKTILRDGIPIANAVEIAPAKQDKYDSLWLSYMSVPDVDVAVKLARLHGGTAYKQPRDLPERGRIAIITDAQGAIFGLVHSPSGDPSDQTDRLHNFIGSELWTTDREKAVEAYIALGGYELSLVEVGPDKNYHLLTAQSFPRAGIVEIPWDDVKPNWIPYIAVNDVSAVIARVEALGGRLLVKPPEEKVKNPLAIIADPSGAVFGIQQIQSMETKGGVQP